MSNTVRITFRIFEATDTNVNLERCNSPVYFCNRITRRDESVCHVLVDGTHIESGRGECKNIRFSPAAFPRSASLLSSIMSDRDPYDLRATYTRFRILVIGRANAGKTTLLQRVCNTTEDPCIYDKNNKNLVSVHRSEDEFCF